MPAQPAKLRFSEDPERPVSFSLRTRLTLWVVAIFSIIHFGTMGIYWLYQSAAISRGFDMLLAERAGDLVETIRPDVPGIEERTLEDRAYHEFRGTRLGSLRVGVFDESGTSVVPQPRMPTPPDQIAWELTMSSLEPQITRADLTLLEQPDPESTSTRLVANRFRGADGELYVLVLVTGDVPELGQKLLIRQGLLIAGIAGPIAAAIAGWFISGIAVAPLLNLRSLARQLRPESLGERIEVAHTSAEVEELTRDLEESRKRMNDAFASQERFISNVSHELKTPMAVLLVEAQTMSREGLPDHALAFIESTEGELLRLGRMVESFLTLSRIRAGRDISLARTVGANDLVMDSIESCQLMAHQQHIRLNPTLLAADDDIETRLPGDPHLLRTMVDNLVRNAIRFSADGDAIDLRLTREGNRVSLAVADRGPGIPEDRLTSYFDRFAQAPEEQRTGRGHGLGLAIAQGIAELHGGTIEVHNREEGGCVFTITLPAYDPEPDFREIAEEEEE